MLAVLAVLTGCGTDGQRSTTYTLLGSDTTAVDTPDVPTPTDGPDVTDSPTTITSEPVISEPDTTTTTVITTAPTDARPLALDLLAWVTVQNEHRGGYVRDLFGYPTSFGGGCDTREMVLRRDSLTPAQVDPYGCKVVAGDWLSLYDGLHHDQPSELEIDHVIALKEAWDSGAWQWPSAALHAFANDLDDVRTLRAVSTATNRAKGDKDPSNWLPPDANDVCRYVADWVAIKVRWQMSMDQSEFGRVRNLLKGPCAGTRVDPIAPPPVGITP